jgi:hypothetical protein
MDDFKRCPGSKVRKILLNMGQRERGRKERCPGSLLLSRSWPQYGRTNIGREMINCILDKM